VGSWEIRVAAVDRPGLSIYQVACIMIMSRILSVLAGVMLFLPVARGAEGGLTPETIESLRQSYKRDEARFNAVSANPIDSLVLNRSVVDAHDTHFSHRIRFKGVTDQHKSGRCWLFAGLNTLRPAIIAKNKLDGFEFSETYLQFWDKLEKANLYLEYMIELRETDPLDREWESVHKWTLDDGGWWQSVVALVGKYGVVPKAAMPATTASDDTDTLNKILERKLHVDAARLHEMHRSGADMNALRGYKKQAMAGVYRILAETLGEPPQEFTWRAPKKEKDDDKEDADKKDDSKAEEPAKKPTVKVDLTPAKKYTPQSFYREVVGASLEDYVSLYYDPLNPRMKHYAFKRSRNLADKGDVDFVNVELEVMKRIAMTSVMTNEPVWFAADVGKDQNKKLGIMAANLYDYGPLFDLNLRLDRSQRIRYRDGGANHAMVFMGVDVVDGKPAKWLVENSWGADKGDKGTWTLYNDWFDEHVYMVIANKRLVPEEILKVFGEPAIVLPPWYPGAEGVK
jgi:bleomycin hydrolase